MADHKNQHYTPRRLLKPFSLDGEGRAINLYTLGHDKSIRNAPVKSQCARNYLYDDDGKIELKLAEVESGFGAIMKKVIDGTETEDDLKGLCFFAHLQFSRTEMAVLRMAALEQDLMREIFGDKVPEHPTLRYYVLSSLNACLQTHSRLEDLKLRIVENQTPVDFVIGDDPAVLVNKYAKQKHNEQSFGLASSGLMLILPLSPRFALLCYDGLVYTVPNLVNGRMVLRKTGDAAALNELQFLKATASIYFREWDSRDSVRSAYLKAKDRRLANPIEFTWGALVQEDAHGHQVFQEVSREAAKAAGKYVIHHSSRYPVPSAWMSGLRYRSPSKTFSDGSVIGHVRQERWLEPDD